MNDAKKTKKQLIEELAESRQQLAEANRRASELEGLEEKLRHVEEALAEERSLLRAFMDNVPDRIFFKDRESRFIRLNVAQAQAFGLSDPQEAIGTTDFDFFPEENAQRFYDDEQRIMETGEPLIDAEWQAPSQDGKMLWRSVTKIPLMDESGRVIGLVGISRDTTAQKQAQEESARLQQEVIEAQQRAIQELSTPIIPVMERIIVMPLIGSIDSLRARDITRTLLAGIREHRARVVILDITGVPIVDSGVAAHLNKTIQAARLKGARTIVTGISDAVAETIIDLGLDWSAIDTLADLQTGLHAALTALGFEMVRRPKGNTTQPNAQTPDSLPQGD
jgi:rsbT co-antagonist protein RsbR